MTLKANLIYLHPLPGLMQFPLDEVTFWRKGLFPRKTTTESLILGCAWLFDSALNATETRKMLLLSGEFQSLSSELPTCGITKETPPS